MPASSSIPETVDIAPSHPGSPILTKVSAHSPQSCSSDHLLTHSIPSPRVITPTDLVTAPTTPVETPIDALTTPIDAVTTPVDVVSTPTGVVATPAGVVATPAMIATPTDDVTTPTNNVTTPTDVAITPTEMVATSTAEVVGAEVDKTNQQKTALAIRPLQKRIVLKKVSKEVEGIFAVLYFLLVCACLPQIYIDLEWSLAASYSRAPIICQLLSSPHINVTL